eukprot:TRINITY_DN17779_c0_g1_i1.p1 TRINITY_DN17779_c0_g1~~TRINITY_DN17779_c0_g1_i1.p1  ORF type:complete len:618 (+),score=155.14 TRINITY_DN17779_c0_g1_i1:75-1928(+)
MPVNAVSDRHAATYAPSVPLDMLRTERRLMARTKSNATAWDAGSVASTDRGALLEYRSAEKKLGSRLLSSLTFDVNNRLRQQLGSASGDGGRRGSHNQVVNRSALHVATRAPQGVEGLFDETQDTFWIGSGYGMDELDETQKSEQRLLTLDELTSALSTFGTGKKVAEKEIGGGEGPRPAAERTPLITHKQKEITAAMRQEKSLQTSAEQRIMHKVQQIRQDPAERQELRHRVAKIKQDKRAALATLKLQRKDMLENNIIVMRTFDSSAALERVSLREQERREHGATVRRTCRDIEGARTARIKQKIAYKDMMSRRAMHAHQADPSEGILLNGVLLLWCSAVVHAKVAHVLGRAVGQHRAVNTEATKEERRKARVRKRWAILRSALIPIRICLQLRRLMDLSAKWTEVSMSEMTPKQVVASLPQQQLLKLQAGVRRAQRHFRSRCMARELFKIVFCMQLQEVERRQGAQELVPLQFLMEHTDTEYDARRRKLDAELCAWRDKNAMQQIQQQATGTAEKAGKRARPYFTMFTAREECESLLELSRVSLAERVQHDLAELRGASASNGKSDEALLVSVKQRLLQESANVARHLNRFMQPGLPEFQAGVPDSAVVPSDTA